MSFWSKKKFKISDSFKELFDSIISVNYTQRPSIAEIRKSKWMNECDISLLPSLKEEFKRREMLLKQKKEEMMIKQSLIISNQKMNKECNNSNKSMYH